MHVDLVEWHQDWRDRARGTRMVSSLKYEVNYTNRLEARNNQRSPTKPDLQVRLEDRP